MTNPSAIQANDSNACMPWWCIASLVFLIAIADVSTAGDSSPTATVETPIGIEGTFFARYDGPAVAALPVDERSAVIVRIAGVVDDDGSTLYELRYVGLRPGSYDLRDFLVRVDGEPLSGFAPAPITVGSSLPADHDGSLVGLAVPPASPPLPYRLLMWTVAGVWVSLSGWLIVRRWLRRRAQPASIDEAELTLADQLRPLVETALAGRITPAEQGRLELLLIAYWRQELDLIDCSPAESLRLMRSHEEAGALLRQLENWLYRRPGTVEIDVADTLAPYRSRPAIDPASLVAEGVIA